MGYDDVRSMLRRAQVGDSVKAWQAATRDDSRLLAGSRRVTQLRIATTILRPANNQILDGDFLTDLEACDEPAARDLIYGRYLASVGIAVATADRYFRVDRSGVTREPITRRSIDAFLGTALPTCSPQTRLRTRTAIGTQFSLAGVTRVQRDGTLVRTGRRPAPVAVLHLVRDDLDERREASDAWLAAHSLAAAIFSIDPLVFAEILETLIAEGRLQRSFYAGEPRILAA